MTDTQINNIKKTWSMKTAKDVTPAIRDMIKKMDIPTQLAIKHANINQLSKLVEADDHEISMARGELEAVADKALKLSSMLQGKSDETDGLEAWVQSKITKAKDYINSVVDYMTYNPDFATEHMIEAFSDQQIAKLKKEYEPLRGARISVTNANKLGYKIKLLGVSEIIDNKVYQRVHPTLIKKSSYIGTIDSVLNAVIVEGTPLGQTIIQGEGAGPGPTSSSLLSDLVSILRGGIKNPFGISSTKRKKAQVLNNNLYTNSLYLNKKCCL